LPAAADGKAVAVGEADGVEASLGDALTVDGSELAIELAAGGVDAPHDATTNATHSAIAPRRTSLPIDASLHQ
jgi:hypothetical protein